MLGNRGFGFDAGWLLTNFFFFKFRGKKIVDS